MIKAMWWCDRLTDLWTTRPGPGHRSLNACDPGIQPGDEPILQYRGKDGVEVVLDVVR